VDQVLVFVHQNKEGMYAYSRLTFKFNAWNNFNEINC